MRNWSWVLLVFFACGKSEPTDDEGPTDETGETVPTVATGTTPPTDTGEEKKTTKPPPAPCDPLDGLTVDEVDISQPWTSHEAQIAVTLSDPAAVAVACQLDGDASEVHLVEGITKQTQHVLRIAGLLPDATYDCTVAPVCPSTAEPVHEAQLVTGPQLEDRLPTIDFVSMEPGASGDYILTNHQNNGNWNGQRRLVIDPDANVRWRAARGAGGGAGGSAVTYSKSDETFTIGGGWPPNNNGRPQQLDMFGSTVLYDTKPYLPNAGSILFHHDARQLSDGRFLTLEEPTINAQGGGTFRGFGVSIVNPANNQVEFSWSSQRAYDDGDLPGGGGDVYHANWVDVQGGVLYASLCTQNAIVAIDVPSGDFRWLLGPGGDFDLVDASGNPLGNDQYPQCQHGLAVRGNNILVYDNGHSRGYSRAVEYEVDETNMVATLLWEWTEPQWFERSLGGVDYTSGGGVLVAMGHIESDTPTPGDRTTFVEIDPTSGDKLWEIRYAGVNDMAFRAYAIPGCDIFANAKYCAAAKTRLEDLEGVLGVLGE